MKKLNIKLIQWTCRIIPGFFWLFYFFMSVISENETKDLFHNPAFSCIFILILFPYLFLIFLVLPGLIFGDKYNGFKFYFISWFLASVTAGVVPVILYWVKVDKKLSECTSNQQEKEDE